MFKLFHARSLVPRDTAGAATDLAMSWMFFLPCQMTLWKKVVMIHHPRTRFRLIQTRYMMDTDICIYLKKRRPPEIAERLPVQAMSTKVAESYGQIRSDLERKGATIGGNDLWIAAHALTLGLKLVTNNDREFKRVPGLRVENWVNTWSAGNRPVRHHFYYLYRASWIWLVIQPNCSYIDFLLWKSLSEN